MAGESHNLVTFVLEILHEDFFDYGSYEISIVFFTVYKHFYFGSSSEIFLATVGWTFMLIFCLQGSGTVASERRENTRIRESVEGSPAKSKVSVSEFHECTSAATDENLAEVPAVETHPRHGEKACFSDESGSIRESQTLSGLVSETVSRNSRVPITQVRSHTLHRRCYTSDERASLLRHNTPMGRHRMAPHDLHVDRRCQ